MKKLELERPLAFLDLETTGVSTKTDRIVEIGIIVRHPEGDPTAHSWRVNPGCPIPQQATDVHGITDADVADCPPFSEVSHLVHRVLEGCDLAGFNLVAFDLPLLQEEFKRYDIAFVLDGRHIIDAFRIFRAREPRNLEAAVRFYTGHEHQGAHKAAEDALATMRVLDGQIERYEDLPWDVEGLARASRPEDWVDVSGKIRWSASGEMTIGFGRHNGRTLRDLCRTDRSYLKWMLGSDFPGDTLEIVSQALGGVFVQREETP